MHSDKKLKNKHKNHKNRHDLPFYQRFFQYFCICFCWKSVKYQKRTNRVYKTTNSEIIIATEHETKYPHSCITSVNRESYKFNESPKVPVKRDSYKLFSKSKRFLLRKQIPADEGKICAIIDLDETLVHSSFKFIKNPDMIIPIEVDGIIHSVYVLKRPFAVNFIKKMGQLFECVLFTASLAKYADPVADLLDKDKCFSKRLFRESCVQNSGNFIKDLNDLGRNISRVVIIDNSPISYLYHPENAVSVTSWFDDPDDRELLNILPLMEELSKSDDVRTFLKYHNRKSQSV